MSSESVPFLLLSGPPGVGKTTVSWEIFDQLIAAGRRPALVDLDLLGASWPVPDGDPYNERVKTANLAAMWQNFHRAGSRCLIAAGVVEAQQNLDNYVSAVPNAALTLCLLTATDDELARRITVRGRERGDGVAKLVDRAITLGPELERNGLADFTVATDGRTVAEVARRIREQAPGWLA